MDAYKQGLSLGEAAFSFLTSLPTEERRGKQQEVNRFLVWCGKGRPINQIAPVEIANYAGRVGAAGGDVARKLEPIRAFLAYAKKEKIIGTNLATHLRIRASIKTPSARKLKHQETLTPEDHAQLKSQLAALEKERAIVAEEMLKAAADKDFRENAPLQAAREQASQIEAKIRQIRASIGTGVIVQEKPKKKSTIMLGSKVILRDIASGSKLTYTLATKNEANPAKNKISIVSPIGKALLNQHQGDVVKVIAPAGELSYQIEQIE